MPNPRKICLNLPAGDLDRSIAFFTALDAHIREVFHMDVSQIPEEGGDDGGA